MNRIIKSLMARSGTIRTLRFTSKSLIGVLLVAVLLMPLMPAPAAHAASPIILTKNFKLTSDMMFDGPGFIIAADNITLNLNGHAITGNGSGPGVDVSGRSGVIIKNGEIKSFGTGVKLEGSDNNIIKGITTTDNTYIGILIYNGSDGNKVRDCTSSNNGLQGIMINNDSNGNVVKDCVTNGNVSAGVLIGGAPDSAPSYNNRVKNTISNNNAGTFDGEDTGTGILVCNADDNILSKNITDGNKLVGISVIVGSDNNKVKDNQAKNNGVYGILVGWALTGPDITSVNNQIIGNELSGNIHLDIKDRTKGGGTAGTANYYKRNAGTSSDPPGLVN